MCCVTIGQYLVKAIRLAHDRNRCALAQRCGMSQLGNKIEYHFLAAVVESDRIAILGWSHVARLERARDMNFPYFSIDFTMI